MSDCEYRVGGVLPPNARTYVTRRADSVLFEKALTGEFCYILSSRQMGKSSLQIRTIGRLRDQGVACGIVDLLQICSPEIQPEQWYAAIAHHIARNFELHRQFKLAQYWREARQRFSPDKVLMHFLVYVLLPRVRGNVVLFVDEIDSVLGLKFNVEDFFGLIYQCYELRSQHPELHRLSWVLSGVAQPQDLMSQSQGNPFVQGQPIQLTGFRLDECDVLLAGLAHQAARPKKVLEAIFRWTGGQPFLTQKLCGLVAQQPQEITVGQEQTVIETLIIEQLLTNWETQDTPEHLSPIRDRLLTSPRRSQLLKLYGQLLRYGEIPLEQSRLQLELSLSGVAIQQRIGDKFSGPVLKLCNHIYRQIFNADWLQQQGVDLAQIKRPYLPSPSDTLEQDAQLLYDHWHRCVRQEAPSEVIERFRSLFISCVGYRNRAIESALRRIVQARPSPEAFNTILNRCCRTVVNYWNINPSQRSMIRYLLNLFEEQSQWDWSGFDVNTTLRRLVGQFTRSAEYRSLQQLFVASELEHGGDCRAVPIANYAYRYPFLYSNYFIHANSPPEHTEEIERQQIERKWQMQRDLRRYAQVLMQQQHQQPDNWLPTLEALGINPTLLNDQDLYWGFKYYLGSANQPQTTPKNLARQLIWHTAKMQPYRDFKRSLYDYLTASVEARDYLQRQQLPYIQKQFKQRLLQYLETIYVEKDTHTVDETLLRQTCSQLLKFLMETPDQPQGHFQFVDLISNCNPLLLTETIMKVMLLSSHTKPQFEERLAVVFRHYDSPLIGESDWLIPFFENINLGLTVNFSGIDFADLNLRFY